MNKTGRSILFIFGTASLLPILFIGVFLTVHMRKMAFEQSMKEANAEIDRVENRIEETLLFIHSIENTIISDSQIMDIIRMNYDSTLEIFNHYSGYNILKKYELTYSDISDIRIYVENETLLDNLDFMRVTKEVKATSWYQNAIALRGQSFGEYYKEGPIVSKDYLLVSRSFRIQRDMEGVIMILLDLKRLNDMIAKEPFHLYLLDSNFRLLTSKENNWQNLSVLEILDITEGKSMWKTDFRGEKYQIIVKTIYQNLIATPLYLVSVIPIKQMVATSKEVALFGSLVVFFSFLSGLALLVGLSSLATHQQEQQYMLSKEQMRFEVLANQVNPHFLFNVLESIRMKAHSNGEFDIASIVQKMGSLIRRNLEISNDYITLREELSFVEDYISVQKFRFGDKIQSYIHFSEELKSLMVLPLTIQPIVENAIIHGLEGVKETGIVTISGKIEAEKLFITIVDNGKGINPEKVKCLFQSNSKLKEKEEKRIGLINILQRIQIKFGKHYGLTIEENHPRGTIVTIIMPVLSKKEGD